MENHHWGNARKTKYPKIFESTYWDGHDGGSHPQIIVNRNNFVEEFDIVSWMEPENPKTLKPPLRGNRFKNEVNPEYPWNHTFDHFELYKRKGKLGYVAVFSRYHDIHPNNEYYQNVIDLGYKQYSQLYNISDEDQECPTYYLLVPYTKPK